MTAPAVDLPLVARISNDNALARVLPLPILGIAAAGAAGIAAQLVVVHG